MWVQIHYEWKFLHHVDNPDIKHCWRCFDQFSFEKIQHPCSSKGHDGTHHLSSLWGCCWSRREALRQSRCDWHVSIGPLGPYILAHRGLTLATPTGLAGKQSWRTVREIGRSEEVAGRISLPMLQNRPLGSWNEVNSMPTHRHHFSVICGLIWLKWQTGNAVGQGKCPSAPVLDWTCRVFVMAICGRTSWV